ncbi:MAG: hypothetical protein ACO3MV_03735 [Flavobacteriales bacterium]
MLFSIAPALFVALMDSTDAVQIVPDSLASDSTAIAEWPVQPLEFCPSEEILIDLIALNNCCCVMGDCSNETEAPGLKVVEAGIQMLRDDIQLAGSCWDFINAVYTRAGFERKQQTIYQGAKGSLLKDPDLIQPGDWIYHINYGFHDVGHSAIFLCWQDYEQRLALTLSHVGQNKLRAGKLGVYDLKGVYKIKRPQE